MYTRLMSFSPLGETKLSKKLTLFCGGKGLNQSIAVAKAGNEVWHAGLVGDDGTLLLDKLKENGVNTNLIYPIPGKSGHAIIQVNSKGQNAFCCMVEPIAVLQKKRLTVYLTLLAAMGYFCCKGTVETTWEKVIIMFSIALPMGIVVSKYR